MPALTLPYTFVNGTIADATQVDANFNALLAGLNTNTRTILTTNTSFFVSSTGSDANTGLDPTLPAATVNHVLNQLYASYDLNGFQVTITVLAGAYSQSILVTGGFIGQFQASQILIQGNVGTPDAVVLTGEPPLLVNHLGQCQIQGFKLASNTTDCIQSFNRSDVAFQAIDFSSAPSGAHLHATRSGQIRSVGPYSISGGAQYHVQAGQGFIYIDSGVINPVFGTPLVTLTGSPNFADDFATVSRSGLAQIFATFSGAATGPRYSAISNGVINTQGQPITYLPGNVADGTPTASGGQYV